METILINSNRSFGNFLEYKLRGSQNRCFALPNFSFGKTTLNNNIMFNFKNPLVSREQLNKQGVTE
jgi:hypothetical protein